PHAVAAALTATRIALWAPRRRNIVCSRGELHEARAIDVHDGNTRGAERPPKREPGAIGRPRWLQSVGDHAKAGAVDANQRDLQPALAIGDEGESRSVGTPRRIDVDREVLDDAPKPRSVGVDDADVVLPLVPAPEG